MAGWLADPAPPALLFLPLSRRLAWPGKGRAQPAERGPLRRQACGARVVERVLTRQRRLVQVPAGGHPYTASPVHTGDSCGLVGGRSREPTNQVSITAAGSLVPAMRCVAGARTQCCGDAGRRACWMLAWSRLFCRCSCSFQPVPSALAALVPPQLH